MLLDEMQYWANKYSHVWPDKELLEIQTIGIPVVRLKVKLIGQIISDISPLTEYMLKFIDLGKSELNELSAVLGIHQNILKDELANEVVSGRLKLTEIPENFQLTVTGKNVLLEGMTRVPKHKTIEFVFDKTAWRLTSWDSRQTFIMKDFERIMKGTLSLKPSNKSTVKLSDFSTLEVSKILRSNAKRTRSTRMEVLSVEQIISRRHAYVPAQILIYGDSQGESDFIIIVDGERSLIHEESLRSKGGLGSLGVKVAKVQRNLISESSSLEVDEDDGEIVKSYQHRPILLDALISTKRRFLLIVPWITRSVIDDDFLRKFEMLLRRGVETTIAFGFHDENGIHDKRRDDALVLKKLLLLSKKYENFNFRWMGENEEKGINHSKIFVADDRYIIGSFNWLSFRGDQYREYRKEDSEMRTKPSVVLKRYRDQIDEVMRISSEMTEKFIPENLPKSENTSRRFYSTKTSKRR